MRRSRPRCSTWSRRCARSSDVAALHQPQPGRDREDVRSRGRALCGRDGGAGAGAPRCSTSRGTPTRWASFAASRGGAAKDHGWLDTIPGFLPPPGAEIAGCIFADRCAMVQDRCRTEHPPMYEVGPVRGSRCHYYEQAPDAAAREGRRSSPKPPVRDLKPRPERTRALQDVPHRGNRHPRARGR